MSVVKLHLFRIVAIKATVEEAYQHYLENVSDDAKKLQIAVVAYDGNSWPTATKWSV